MAIVQRHGQVTALSITQSAETDVLALAEALVHRGATVYTDEYDIYHFLASAGYQHQVITHGHGEYTRGDVHINTAEALFSLLRPYLTPFRGVSKRSPDLGTRPRHSEVTKSEQQK